MARIDQQLALYEFFGGTTTTATQPINAGDTTITVSDPIQSGPIQIVQVGDMESAPSLSEIVYVKSSTGTGPYTLTLTNKVLGTYTAGSTVFPFISYTSSTFPWLKAVANGEPMTMPDEFQPVLLMMTPRSTESRQYAQKKMITYQLRAYLVAVIGAPSLGDGGTVAINTFYSWLDQIAAEIRTNKTLETPSYPSGAAMKFGEEFVINETHERVENSVKLIAQIDIVSVEQVNA